MTQTHTQLSKEEIARRGQTLYEDRIRSQVETPDNIGKMVIIDVETGDFGVDDTGLVSARRLQSQHENAPLFGIRIGYRVADALGGVMERVENG